MSDYVHNKVVRLPIPEKFHKNIDSLEELIKKNSNKRLFNYSNDKYFEIVYTDNNKYYIDWVYYSTYGELSGEFGNVRKLTKKEIDTIKPKFDMLGIKYNIEDLRLIEYSYYNCCEPPDYYSVNIKDESKNF